jgi:hypothetical protein
VGEGDGLLREHETVESMVHGPGSVNDCYAQEFEDLVKRNSVTRSEVRSQIAEVKNVYAGMLKGFTSGPLTSDLFSPVVTLVTWW